MTDATPNPGPGDRALIENGLKRAFQADPMDRMLQDYRPMTVADVLRFDVHQTGESGQRGEITPLYRTDSRMTPRPLRILRGFLHRLDGGFHAPVRVTGGEQPAPNVRRPGHGLVTLVTSPQGVIDASGEIGDFAWNEGLRRKRGTGFTRSSLDRIYHGWGWATLSNALLSRPSGPYAWLRPDGRFVLADTDGGGCPVLLDAVWRPASEPSGDTEHS